MNLNDLKMVEGYVDPCPYCGKMPELVFGRKIYPGRLYLYSKRFYLCEPCNAYVGCHEGTDIPFGVVANAELRAARSEVHRVFDPLWNALWQTRKIQDEKSSKSKA